jgi:hypothetical protein
MPAFARAGQTDGLRFGLAPGVVQETDGQRRDGTSFPADIALSADASGHIIGLVAIGMAVIIAALLFRYAKSRALSEHAKQYGRMSIIFANAKRHLEEHMKAGRSADAVALIEESGKEALVENGDWVVLHRERPLPVPKA